MHEELVAYIADQQGYYADEGVHVALRHGATIGLGRALLSRLADGIPWVALTVPLFWFLARSGLTSLADLADLAVGVPATTTPWEPGDVGVAAQTVSGGDGKADNDAPWASCKFWE